MWFVFGNFTVDPDLLFAYYLSFSCWISFVLSALSYFKTVRASTRRISASFSPIRSRYECEASTSMLRRYTFVLPLTIPYNSCVLYIVSDQMSGVPLFTVLSWPVSRFFSPFLSSLAFRSQCFPGRVCRGNSLTNETIYWTPLSRQRGFKSRGGGNPTSRATGI